MSISVTETHPLTPFLPQQAKLLMLGSFPPPQNKWKMQFYYPNFQNDMWRIMGICFFNDKNHFLDLANKNFFQQQIEDFLNEKGIAIFDAACEVIRLKGNASDQFLQVVQATDLSVLLKQIPECHSIMTTGDKATDTLMTNFEKDSVKPQFNQPSQVNFLNRSLNLYRLPSSSRAYPLALEKKAEIYADFFNKIGLI
ncbi:uracil-DNA glycosylase family protein [Acinetobacter sp. ME22]|uniref:uracil-DNA glycosylase family protein n=1 Tax=Acinetobacter sp. ME22 TaxID=2904802 RepID=UPI001EDA4070|nr:uracil-DNA glycosylase family protein [Acinetobacter sp. ME22]MCG2572694.1 uracil-DNA glycosylase family protein [Acinetobacter sp. ME22]